MIRMLHRLVLALAIALPGQAAAEDAAKALELFERGEFEESATMLEPLSDAGDPAASYILGIMHLNLVLENADQLTGAQLIESAAENNHLPAQTELARMYRMGDGVEQDFAKMMVWYQRAAEQGDVGSQLFVADGYAYGYGVPTDLVEAYKWYEIAIQYWGALAVRAREIVAERMTDEQIAEAVQQAGEWLQKHAEN